MDTITTAAALQEQLGIRGGVDDLNQVLVTECLALDNRDVEQSHLDFATRLQIEGFVLHPRRQEALPFEIVTSDPDEADFLLRMVRDSQAWLATRQASAIGFARFAGTSIQRMASMTDTPVAS